ncbi:MAG: DUF4159 domain-containing protein [Pseudomonadota bacterium]
MPDPASTCLTGPWSRRRLLEAAAGAAVAALLPGRALALGDATRLDIAQLSLASGTLLRPRAWERLLYEVAQTTSVETLARAPALAPEDPALFDHPLAVLVGDGALPALSDEATSRLARYLQYGGFLFVDDASGLEHSAFDASVRALCARLFPTRPLAPLPRDHSLYRAFFLIHHPVGRLARADWLEGVSVGEVTPLVYCRDDLSGALDRGDDGRERFPVQPGGETQRREAIKLGINLVLYALTSNYKHDITHVRQLMEEGRL